MKDIYIYICTHTHIYGKCTHTNITKSEGILITITGILSVPGHIVIAGIYNDLIPLECSWEIKRYICDYFLYTIR